MLDNHMTKGNAEAYADAPPPDDVQRFAAQECLTMPEHWHEHQLSADEARQMARIMSELDNACSGDTIAQTAIFSALHVIQKNAIADILDAEGLECGP